MTWHPLNHEQKIDCLEVEKCTQYVQIYMLFGFRYHWLMQEKFPIYLFALMEELWYIFNFFYKQIFMLSSNMSSIHKLMWKVTFLLFYKDGTKLKMRFSHLFT